MNITDRAELYLRQLAPHAHKREGAELIRQLLDGYRIMRVQLDHAVAEEREACATAAGRAIMAYAGGYKRQPEFAEALCRLSGFVEAEIKGRSNA